MPTPNSAPQEAVPDLLQTPTVITITIPTQAYFVSGIRDFVLKMTKNLTGFSEQWAFRFQAVVDELCNNAIEYGSKSGETIKISLISDAKKSLEVHVEDSGTGPQKMTADQMSTLYRQRKEMINGKQYMGIRGRGLPMIVGAWTDELMFEDVKGGGLRVKMKKYLRKEEETVSSSSTANANHLVIQ